MNNISTQATQATAQLNVSQAVKMQGMPGGLNAMDMGFLDVLASLLSANGEAALALEMKKNAETLGAQLNAEALTINPLFAMMLQGQPGAISQQEPLSADFNLSPAADIYNESALSAELLSQLLQPQDARPAENGNSLESFASAFGILTGEGNGEGEFSALTAAGPGNALSALQNQSQFERSVNLAQELLKASPLEPDSEETDLEALQRKVDAGVFLQHSNAAFKSSAPAAADVKSAEALEAKELFPQIQSAVTRHAANGDTDFTIKLRPEGLGEITVKLLETDGKITLSLSAANPNVQRLLGGELNSLRDIMRPYNVEVSQIAEPNNAQSMDMQQQLSRQFSGQFSGQGYTGRQQPHAVAHDGDFTETAAPAAAAPTAAPDSLLNAYI